jgi:Holliday junction resolvase RusA-like endonuclease
MRLHIEIPGKGFSVNGAYTRNHSLTAAARRWKLEMHKKLLKYQNECAVFSTAFNPRLHELHMTITNYMPNLYTADGRVSHASNDTDNLNKLTIDSLFAFLPAVDDCAITRLVSSKRYAIDYGLSISLELIPFDLESIKKPLT